MPILSCDSFETEIGESCLRFASPCKKIRLWEVDYGYPIGVHWLLTDYDKIIGRFFEKEEAVHRAKDTCDRLGLDLEEVGD